MPITSFMPPPLLDDSRAPAPRSARTYKKTRREGSADAGAVDRQADRRSRSHQRIRRRSCLARVPVRGRQHTEEAAAILARAEAEVVESLLGDVEGLTGQRRHADPARL